MREIKNKPWFKYAVTAAIGAVFILLFLISYGTFGSSITASERMKAFSDAFFLIGTLIFCMGLFVLLSRKGSLDGLGYCVQFVRDRLLFHANMETYADYKARKREKKTPCLFLIVVGGSYLLIAGIFTALFYLV
jgi:hypothetical protein